MPPPDLQHIPDNELWQMIIDGHVAAYSELYERYWESLFETTYWHVLDKATAKDIVQEVFVYCWQKREQIRINEYYRIRLFTFKANTDGRFKKLVIEITSLTYNSYNYLNSTSMAAEKNEDGLSEKVIVFNNIENGLGIIGGVAQRDYELTR